jgi:acetolactate synthase-1/2/3 large subunit
MSGAAAQPVPPAPRVPQAPSARMTGGEAVVRTLMALGVRVVFGIPSVHNLPVVDALGRVPGAPEFVGARHEQGACTMADGYARATGGLGVCLTSTGPGAANSVASMFEAEVSCSPVLQITGQVPTQYRDRRKGVLHEIRDQPGMLRAVTKGVSWPAAVEDIPGTVLAGARLALSGRPGPAVVECSIDLQYAEAEVSIPQGLVVPPAMPAAPDVDAAARLLHGARRVAIWAGGGAVRARADVAALAERLGALVVTTGSGRGALDEAHPLCAGPFSTDPEVAAYLEACDVWLGLGTRFRYDSTAEWKLSPPAGPGRGIIHVNVDPEERDRNYPAAVYVAADAGETVRALLGALPPGRREPAPEIPALIEGARGRALERLGPWVDAVAAMEEILPPETVLVRDATMAAYTFGNRLVRVHGPGRSIYPAGVAIGLGLPFALGAQVADRARPVVAMCGDGGFMLNLGELASAVQARIPAVILLFNDRAYDVLRRNQDRTFAGRRVGVELHAPDFQALGRAFGVRTLKVARMDEFGPRLRQALQERESGPVLVEVDVDAVGAIPR